MHYVPPKSTETRMLCSGMPASPVAQSFNALTSCLKPWAKRPAEMGFRRQLIQDMVQDKLHVAKCESSLGKRYIHY